MSQAAVAQEVVLSPEDARDAEAQKLIKNYMWWSMGAGLVPIPLFDIAAVCGIQIKMIVDLSKHYGIPFSENKVKNIVSSLVGTLAADALARGTVGTLIIGTVAKFLPVAGSLVGVASVPLFAGAVTYGIGRVFATHFATGGTLMNLDPAQVREYFKEQYAEGSRIAKDLQGKGSK